MKIHFIAIGGALMHNLALALQQKGYTITGSDDEIYDPSYTRLKNAGLLPAKMGWNIENIKRDLDAVIVGMHARPNNPELLKAQELGLTIYSYPEYIYLQSQHKKRIVVGGSHGKTTTTSMIMHILKHYNIDFDYAVGAQLNGFELMVRLSDAPIIVIEGDEYLSSPIDILPKFLHYHPHIAVLTGVAWDHINVFPTFKKYKKQFKKFIKSIMPNGTLIYYKKDKHLKKMANLAPAQIIAYDTPANDIQEHQTYLRLDYNYSLKAQTDVGIPLQIFGKHNLQNFQAARLVCRELGLSDGQILEAIQAFEGAAKRLETLAKNDQQVIYKDFAHAPSKVKATINAVKGQYADRKLIAVLELHTFSSLNIDFLEEYLGSMGAADTAYVYYNRHTIQMKKLKDIAPKDVEEAFYHPNLTVFTDNEALEATLQKDIQKQKANVLLMSSGNWGGMDIMGLIKEKEA
ncbi:UDP-N-acetylmuramate--L-alanine ligase [Aureispira anguillae]|uniref:Mur ligase family protein n=1 Tax=Aureispira anguillae TaxID=2864201 RepID=A0A916DXW4_9BACT|nr:Mur ligase family protein [Aureispira anguillae]BDS15461.1 Mur ligase family protein [Aureispira anguillae]